MWNGELPYHSSTIIYNLFNIFRFLLVLILCGTGELAKTSDKTNCQPLVCLLFIRANLIVWQGLCAQNVCRSWCGTFVLMIELKPWVWTSLTSCLAWLIIAAVAYIGKEMMLCCPDLCPVLSVSWTPLCESSSKRLKQHSTAQHSTAQRGF